MKKLLISCFIIVLSLSACGVSGPLRHPGEPVKQKPLFK